MKILDDSLIARLNRFNLQTKNIVEGFMTGLHKSPYHGFSVEFSDYQQYNQGDSIKKIDWKVFAKTERYYIKRYEEETNLKVYILLDHSKSMDFDKSENSKLEFAKKIAGAISYLAIRQHDAAGIITFNDKITNRIPPKALKSNLKIIVKNLVKLKAEGKTSSSEILHNLAESIKRRSLIILISDLLDDPEKLISGFKHFRYNKHTLMVFHIQDKNERDFQFKSETEFIDSETEKSIVVSPWQIRKTYLESKEKFYQNIKEECLFNNIEYHTFTVDEPFEKLMTEYLVTRQKLF